LCLIHSGLRSLFLCAGRSDIGLGLCLTLQCSLQGDHSDANSLGIARGIGGLQGFGGVQHQAVARAQGSFGLFPFSRFAVEGVINRLAKCVPQLLLLAPVNGDCVGLRLPALLQRFHGIDAQHGCCT
jgi:hypothetical protein